MRLLSLTATLLCLSVPAFASDIAVSSVTAFETSKGMKNGAITLMLQNNGKTDDKLVSASTPAAADTQIHLTTVNKGISEMRKVDSVSMKPGEKVFFSPSSYHLMLMDLKAPLKAGTQYPLTLTFEKAGKVETKFVALSRTPPKDEPAPAPTPADKKAGKKADKK